MLGLTALNGILLSVWGRTFLDVVVCDAAETAAPDTAPHCLSSLSLVWPPKKVFWEMRCPRKGKEEESSVADFSSSLSGAKNGPPPFCPV